MYWKNQRLDVLFNSDIKIRPLFSKIAQDMGLSIDEFFHLTFKEIKSWFSTKKLPAPKKEIRQRIKGYSMHKKNKKVYFGSRQDRHLQSMKGKAKEQTRKPRLLAGDVAYPCKATGKVKLVFGAGEAGKLKEDEILVTPMTRPEMICGLENAVAFVTDHGGMLCHAAIISREMKKPCITNTVIATKILKKGQLIEVDADRGVIKIPQ